jgi:hypothetical protein
MTRKRTTIRATYIAPRDDGETATSKTALDPYTGEAVQLAAYAGKFWPYSPWGACFVSDAGELFCECPTRQRDGECRHCRGATRRGLPERVFWYPDVGPALTIGHDHAVTLRRLEEAEAVSVEARAA